MWSRAAVATCLIAASLACGGSAGAGPAPAVVVSIKPIHSLVAGVMDGIGAPQLLIEGAGSPHSYALRPSEARALADQILARAPVALRMIKEAMNEGYDLDLPKGLAIEAKAFALAFSTDDQREGVAAFLEKRKPVFRGR